MYTDNIKRRFDMERLLYYKVKQDSLEFETFDREYLGSGFVLILLLLVKLVVKLVGLLELN